MNLVGEEPVVVCTQFQSLDAVLDRITGGKEIEVPIEAPQRLGRIQGRAPHAQSQLFLRPPLDLVFEQAFEKLDVGLLAIDGLPVAGVQGGQDSGQPELLQLWR
jgi:hypothetical protein